MIKRKTLKDLKIIKDEICQCGCSKKAHMPHQLDKHGGKCMICIHCPIYTWKGFEFVDLEDVKQEAIKWVKNRQDRIKELNEAVPSHQREMWISQNEAIIAVFKTFFNIKEEELQ
ncbi:MAG TPA: hypothetical protein ENI02_02795 [Candidatus Aminicenantes bacterium]|nr:hypothetical protein [Candidatus Aminicenantes bacterium]